MTAAAFSGVTPQLYNVLHSIEGQLLGIDNSKLPTKALGNGAAAATNPVGEYAPFIIGKELQGLRLFLPALAQGAGPGHGIQGNDYKECVRISHLDLFDDFLGKAIDVGKWNVLKGSDGSAATAINIAQNGTARLTSGAGGTHTMAVNGAQLVGNNNFLVSTGAVRMEARLGDLSAATSQSICFGFCDASTLTAPFTLATATVTANGQNGACFLQDAAGTNAGLNCVAVNAGGSPQVIAIPSYSVNAATFYNRFRVEIDASGNASFFIDGVLVATITLAVATTATLSPTVGMFSEATSASQTLDIDYMLAQGYRV